METIFDNIPPDIFEFEQIEPVKESLQRTEEWFKQREGKFTGSEIYKLMGTSPATSKFEWGTPEKLIDFNETAKKYIFSRAKERQRKKVLKRSIGKNGEYGEKAEKIVVELLKIKYPDYKFEETRFLEFIKDIAGSSPDRKVTLSFGPTKRIALEIKLATIWDTLYIREQLVFDHKHKDFWQVQSEILSLKVEKCLYVVAEPPEYLEDMTIDDLSEKIVEASPIHQEALIQRCMIGNDAILRYLSGVEFHEAVRQACTEYKTPGEQMPEIGDWDMTSKPVLATKKPVMPFESGDKPKIVIPF